MRYEEAMKYITEVGNFGSNYGLERTHKLLEYLGNPEKDLKLIHIAGTNGKGSTTSMITEILIGAGYKVGMYTSPFIEEFEERIQINRNNIPKETLADLMDEVKEAVDKVIKGGYNHPTEFEIITEGYFGNTTTYTGWLWEEGKTPVSAIMYIWNSGDMVYRV